MFGPIVRSELAATLKRPLLYLCAAVFFLLAFRTIAITSPTASGVIWIGSLWHNSPYIIAKLTTVLSVVGLFAAALLIAPAVQRDFQHRSHPFFLTLPITRADYLLGRFTGAFGATLLVFAGGMAGVLVAALSIPPEFIGPHRAIAFVQPLLLFALPNLLLAGAICFAVATLSRGMMGVYISAVVMMVILGIGQSIVSEALQKGLVSGPWAYIGALAEPFGAAALEIVTAAWSPAEKNLRAIPMANFLLVHRVVWSGIAIGLLAFTRRRFDKGNDEGASGGPARPAASVAKREDQRCRPGRPAGGAPVVSLVVLTMRELRLTVGHLAFVVLAFATVANLSSNFLGNVRGQHVHPRTGFFLQHALNVDAIVIVLTIFFAGIIVWRERGHRTHEIFDSQPLPNAVLFGSKLAALLLMQTAYAALVVAYGVFVQLVLFHYTNLEPGVYLAAVFGVKLPGWWTIAIVALLLQAVASNMYAGYAMSAVAIGAASVLPPLGRLAGLLSPGYAPSYVYSDMNGFGHYATPILWYRAYWGLVSIGLVIVAAMLWPRGATRRFRMTALLGVTLLAAIGCAAVIARNTRIEPQSPRFEQLAVEAIDLTADFYPRERRLHVRGTMTVSGEKRHYDYDVAARDFSEDGHLVRNGSVILGNDPEYFPQFARGTVPHWTNFHAIVSTDADQQPVASGDRVREWSSGKRRFAEFKTDRVIGTLFMLGSGNYARATERAGAVDVEILYHPDHAYNLRSMLAGAKCGLEYGSRNFAPYPHRTLRIVELPAYTMQGNAQALSSVILWGENGGFITDVARDAGIDRVFSTAAHETGHQWWGNAVPVMNEVLSDDMRVACIEQTFGRERTVEFLRDMRWAYFRGRDFARDSGRPEPERSLRDGGQYNSGYILMWRLRRILGDDAVNAALHDVVDEFGYRSDRAPAPADVAEAIKRHAPPELHPLIADTFDRITLHPIRARAAHAVKLSDGRYRLTISADLRKSYVDANELAQPAPLEGYADWIDVGVYAANGKPLSLATQRITDPNRDLSIVVDQPPARVVLDPLCTLLDADVSDNEVDVNAATTP